MKGAAVRMALYCLSYISSDHEHKFFSNIRQRNVKHIFSLAETLQDITKECWKQTKTVRLIRLTSFSQLVEKYNKDSTITALLNKYDFYMSPVANPDGYEYTHTRVGINTQETSQR